MLRKYYFVLKTEGVTLKLMRNIAIMFLVTFVLFEAVLRLIPQINEQVNPFYKANNFNFNPVTHYTLLKDRVQTYVNEDNQRVITVVTNSNGYRNIPFSDLSKKERVLVVGDSFTEGWNVNQDETWVSLLDQNMPSSDFVNLGVHNHDIARYYMSVKHWVSELSPDRIVIAIFVENDVYEYPDADWLLTRLNFAKYFRSLWIAQDVKDVLGKQAARKASVNKVTAETDDVWPSNCSLPYDGLSEHYINSYIAARSRGLWQYDETSATFEASISSSIEYLQRIVDEVSVPVSLVLIPNRTDVDDSWWAVNQCAFGLKDEQRRVFYDAFAAELDILGVDVVNLLGKMRAMGDRELYFRNDAHWNSLGHEAAAAIISQHFR